MGRLTPARYIPSGSVKVADKSSDAVAYVYDCGGKPAARVYVGKQTKPVLNCYFRTSAGREAAVRRVFEMRRKDAAAKAEAVASRKGQEHTLQVGDILRSLWGYEQTNVDFYEVVAVSGCMVTLRELAQVRVETDWARGKCVPQSGDYVGEPIRRKARGESVRIESYAGASKWGTRGPGGIVTGEATNWTAYH